jgi:hypothetical protein
MVKECSGTIYGGIYGGRVDFVKTNILTLKIKVFRFGVMG